MELSQKNLESHKQALDDLRKQARTLADAAELAMISCCRCNDVANRDRFAEVASELEMARAHMTKARSIGGTVEGGGVFTRGGST